jgi:hypothetical protein
MQWKNILLSFLVSVLTFSSFSQKRDSTGSVLHLNGAVTVTHKGISFIPSFSLGKPAAIFDLSLGKGKIFFEPQMRFSLKGKPWSFLFWGRYKLVTNNKFKMNLGLHLGMNFRNEVLVVNGLPSSGMVARRYLAGELAPNYFISKKVSIGSYYLYSRGLDKGTTKNNHFVTINSSISDIRLGGQFRARVVPQVYYLALDARDGLFVTSTFNLEKKNFPLSFQSILNKSIETDIAGSEKFLWNISLIYSFGKNYVPHK